MQNVAGELCQLGVWPRKQHIRAPLNAQCKAFNVIAVNRHRKSIFCGPNGLLMCWIGLLGSFKLSVGSNILLVRSLSRCCYIQSKHSMAVMNNQVQYKLRINVSRLLIVCRQLLSMVPLNFYWLASPSIWWCKSPVLFSKVAVWWAPHITLSADASLGITDIRSVLH